MLIRFIQEHINALIIWNNLIKHSFKFSLLEVTWQIHDKISVVYGPRLFARKFARRNHWNNSWSFGRFYGCRIPRLNVRLSSNMSDYSSMATLQNNSQTAKFAAALQRAKLVREISSAYRLFLYLLVFSYSLCLYTYFIITTELNPPSFCGYFLFVK